MDGPQTGGFCRPSCRFRGRSQPAPTARVIPAGRLFRGDGATRAPALGEFLEDPARAPQHALFTGFARVSSVPPRARIGIVSPITTRGLPHRDCHIPARPNAYRRYVTVRSSRYRARPGSERLAPTAHLALHGQRVLQLPEQRRGVGHGGRERLPRCFRPQRGPHGGRRITGRRPGPPGDGLLTFPQGSIAPQARAGSDPEHDGSGDGRGVVSFCRTKVAPRVTPNTPDQSRESGVTLHQSPVLKPMRPASPCPQPSYRHDRTLTTLPLAARSQGRSV